MSLYVGARVRHREFPDIHGVIVRRVHALEGLNGRTWEMKSVDYGPLIYDESRLEFSGPSPSRLELQVQEYVCRMLSPG